LSGGNQPANISSSTVVKRLRLCSCHETLKSLLKNRKCGGLFYLTLSDISGIVLTIRFTEIVCSQTEIIKRKRV